MNTRHTTSPLTDIRNEMAKRRGRDWAFPTLPGAQTALIGCDISRLGLSLAPKLRAAIPRIDWLAKTVRVAGGSVIWTHFGSDAFDGPEGEVLGEAQLQQLRPRLVQTSWTEANEAIHGAEHDRSMARAGYSAFHASGSHLPHLLKDMQIDTVILAGAETDGSVESNARDACRLGFRVVVASDCCASQDETAHLASLKSLHRRFADIRPTEDIVAELRRNMSA